MVLRKSKAQTYLLMILSYSLIQANKICEQTTEFLPSTYYLLLLNYSLCRYFGLLRWHGLLSKLAIDIGMKR